MNLKRQKRFFVFIFLVAIFLTYSQVAFALEADYPTIPLLGVNYQINSSTSLVQFIQYFFVFLIAVCGIIAVVSIAYSGVKIMLTAGSPNAISDAKERIFGAILGIVLLMTSFIILQTINPQLVTPSHAVKELPPGTVWYRGYVGEDPDYEGEVWDDGYVYIQAPEAESNTINIPEPYNEIYYTCDEPSQKLLVWLYDEPNFKIDRFNNGSPIVRTASLNCEQELPIKGGVASFKRKFQDAGVYYYLKEDCKGISSEVQKFSGDIPPFDNRANEIQAVRSVRIVSGVDPRTLYGVVLSKNPDFGGECSAPLINRVPNNDQFCFNLSDMGTGVALLDVFDPNGEVAQSQFAPYDNNDRAPSAKYMHLLNFDGDYALRENDSVKLYSKDFVAEFKQAGATCAPPHVCNIGSHLSYVNPDPILRPPAPFPVPPGSTQINGIGARYTPSYASPPNQEERFADGTGGGSSFFSGLSDAIIGIATGGFFTGSGGAGQCLDTNSECIRKIEHNGTYYTVLYGVNRAIKDRACKVITGTRELDTLGILNNGRVIEQIDIIPTTP